ncbi:MAG: hypothetical protein PHQ41_05385 [Candidatus Cloacimonetes bacterium]|nr:hypothetical protein [Candidatus Cloacimonadota bacterium]
MLRNVAYFNAKGAEVSAYDQEGRKHAIAENLDFLVSTWPGLFIRTHEDYAVAFDQVIGVSQRYPTIFETEEPAEVPTVDGVRLLIMKMREGQNEPEECELHLRGVERTIPVTVTNSVALKQRLGVASLQHLDDELPSQKRLRKIGIIDFGWRDLDQLDPADEAAVTAFREKWDIRLFDRKRMLSYFRQIGNNRLDKRRMLLNVVFQIHRWMLRGIEKLTTGNIRTVWYETKGLLTYHSFELKAGDVDIYYSVMQELVEDHRLVRYQDFGFHDVNAMYREVGTERPHIIAVTEKAGQFALVEEMAKEVGGSLICTRGEPGSIMLEFFADSLLEVVKGKPLEIFCVTDMNPAGFSIPKTLAHGLRWRGLNIKRVVTLVDMAAYTDRQIMMHRTAMVRYREHEGKIIPVQPKNMSRITNVRKWWEKELRDPRLRDEKPAYEGGKLITIYGIDSDVAIEGVFLERFRVAVKDALE